MEAFADCGRCHVFLLHGKEYWDQRKAYSSFIVTCLIGCTFSLLFIQLFSEIVDAKMVPSVALVQQTVYQAMELADGARLRPEVKGDIKRGISCRLYQNQLGHCQHMFILPHM